MILWKRINSGGRRSGSKELRPSEKGGEDRLEVEEFRSRTEMPIDCGYSWCCTLVHLKLSSGLIMCLC